VGKIIKKMLTRAKEAEQHRKVTSKKAKGVLMGKQRNRLESVRLGQKKMEKFGGRINEQCFVETGGDLTKMEEEK